MKNESGYALLTVLLIIVIFMVVSLAFFSQSFNSVKQNNLVETKSQSVALAEMGVDYFYQTVSNTYKRNLPVVEAEMKKEMEEDRKSNELKTAEEYKQRAISLMIERLNTELSEVPKKEVANEASFTINFNSGHDIYSTDDGIEIKYEAVGSEKGKNTKIGTSLSISMGVEENEMNNGTEGALPDFQSVKKPEVKQNCLNPSEIKKDCSEILIKDREFKNEKNLENVLIYSNNLIKFQNANELNNVKIHANGLIAENMNNLTNSFIETIGSSTIEGPLRMSNSKLFSNGSILFKGHLEIEDRSFMYVFGSSTIDEHLTIGSGSKACVNGSLSVYGDLEVNGELYVIEPIDGVLGEERTKYIVDDATFIQKCSQSPASLEILSDEIINRRVEYDY